MIDLLKKRVHIFNMNKGTRSFNGLSEKVLKRIKSKRFLWAFTPSDFADLGDPRVVGMALTRLVRQGTVQRVRRGIYEIPRDHPVLGRVGASADAITAAIARRDALKLLPSGAHAANVLGLSTQVAAKTAYGIAGRSRVQPAGGRAQVILRRRSPRAMAMAGRASGWLAEALRNMGRQHVTTERLRGLKASLGPKQRRELLADVRYAPAWMRPFFLELARDD